MASLASTTETNQIEFHIFVGNQPFMRNRVVNYFEGLEGHENTTVSGWQNQTVKSTFNIKSTNETRKQEIVNGLVNPFYIQRDQNDVNYVYGGVGEDIAVTISSFIDTVIGEKFMQLTRELNAEQRGAFDDEWRLSTDYATLERDIRRDIFNGSNFSVSIIESTYHMTDVITYLLGFNILFNKEAVMNVFNAWYPENRYYYLLINNFNIEVTWNFNENQSEVRDGMIWMGELNEPTYNYTTAVTFKIPFGVHRGPFDRMVEFGEYERYNDIPLTGDHTDKISFIQIEDNPNLHVEGNQGERYMNVYFTYIVNKIEDGSDYDLTYPDTIWNSIIATIKHHTADCMAQFCNRNLNPMNEQGQQMYRTYTDDTASGGYGWKPTEEATEMLWEQDGIAAMWRQWFDSGVQPQRFEVETIPRVGYYIDSSDEEEDEEDAPIPAFHDRLVKEQDNMLGLGENIKYEDFLNLGNFNITEKLIYDNYLADVRDVGCPSDGKSNLEYPMRTGPSQSQIYCMADFVKWIKTPNYYGDANPLNKLDPGTNQPLREMTIHIMDPQDIEEQEWKDIQIARTTLEVDMKNLNLNEGAKIQERKESLRKNTVFNNELKNRLAVKFREQEQKLKMDIRAIEEKIKHLPKTKRLLTLAKIERNSVARIFAKLKF